MEVFVQRQQHMGAAADTDCDETIGGSNNASVGANAARPLAIKTTFHAAGLLQASTTQATSDNRIPAQVIAQARRIDGLPNVLKVGLVVAGTRFNALVACRDSVGTGSLQF
jgi:lipid-binding SYLF domain-containing protein